MWCSISAILPRAISCCLTEVNGGPFACLDTWNDMLLVTLKDCLELTGKKVNASQNFIATNWNWFSLNAFLIMSVLMLTKKKRWIVFIELAATADSVVSRCSLLISLKQHLIIFRLFYIALWKRFPSNLWYFFRQFNPLFCFFFHVILCLYRYQENFHSADGGWGKYFSIFRFCRHTM